MFIHSKERDYAVIRLPSILDKTELLHVMGETIVCDHAHARRLCHWGAASKYYKIYSLKFLISFGLGTFGSSEFSVVE